jgi:signal transduction histidine kinase
VINQADQKHLQRQNEQLKSILELNDSGVIYSESDGKVSYVNRALKRMFAIDDDRQDELTLTTFENHLAALLDPTEPLRKPISAMLDQMQLCDVELTQHLSQLVKLASPRPAVLQISGSVSAEGGLIFYFRDITTEFEVDRMKSEFLATAAHELRTPLASISGFTELMLARAMSPEKQRELLTTIHTQSQVLANLINELLDLSRIESRQGKDFHRQHCLVESIVAQTIRGLLVKGDKRQVNIRLAHGKQRIMVDPEKTMQALLNVLSNAYKYSPNGGAIELETLMRGDDEEVGIRVTDQGLGMSTQDLSRVFDRFFRADPSGKIPGTGLGMSLVKEITELQEGNVQVESELGRGTSVTLWFPVASDFLLSRPFTPEDD